MAGDAEELQALLACRQRFQENLCGQVSHTVKACRRSATWWAQHCQAGMRDSPCSTSLPPHAAAAALAALWQLRCVEASQHLARKLLVLRQVLLGDEQRPSPAGWLVQPPAPAPRAAHARPPRPLQPLRRQPPSLPPLQLPALALLPPGPLAVTAARGAFPSGHCSNLGHDTVLHTNALQHANTYSSNRS